MKTSKPYLGGALAAVTLATGALVAASTPGSAACFTLSITSCELDRELDHLEILRASGTNGARTALLSTIGQYDLDEESENLKLADIYRRIDGNSSDCIISSLQNSVENSRLNMRTAAIENNQQLAVSDELPTPEQRITLLKGQDASAFAPALNDLGLCLAESSPHSTTDSGEQFALDCKESDVQPLCINDSTPGLQDVMELNELLPSSEDDLSQIEDEEEPEVPEDQGDKEAEPSESPSDEAEPSESATPSDPTNSGPPVPTNAPEPIRPEPEPTLAPQPEPTEPSRTLPPDYAEKPRPIPTTEPPTLTPEEESDSPDPAPSATESREGSMRLAPSSELQDDN